LYNGQDVYEIFGGASWFPINQKLNGGKYVDPVFVFRYKNNSANPYIVAANSQEAQQWPTAQPASFPTGVYPAQNIRVRIAGFELQAVGTNGTTLSSPAIQNRQLSASGSNIVTVTWP
jgi:hypothetical protein